MTLTFMSLLNRLAGETAEMHRSEYCKLAMQLIILDKATTNNSFIQQNLTKCLLWADHFIGNEGED